jgi:hypothetical protein
MGAGYLPRLAGFFVVLALASSSEAKPPRAPATAPGATPAATRAGKAKPPAQSPAPPEPGSTAPPPTEAPEKGVQGQPKGSGAAGTPKAQTEESKEGVKTYKFGAVEVESRLKSPELIYFMRRVRAEFAAGELGHRSFLPELHSTERLPTFR